MASLEAGNNNMKKKIQLNLGCGVYLVKDFINIDKFYTLKQIRGKKGLFKNSVIEKGSEYVQADICKLPFKDNSVDYIESIDALEHIPFCRIIPAFQEMYRVLKPGKTLCFATINFDAVAKEWTDRISGKPFDNEEIMKSYFDLMEVVFGNQTYKGEFHVIPFNPYFLGFLLNKVGFKNSNIKMRIYPAGTKCATKKILKTSRYNSSGPAVMRTEAIIVQAKK